MQGTPIKLEQFTEHPAPTATSIFALLPPQLMQWSITLNFIVQGMTASQLFLPVAASWGTSCVDTGCVDNCSGLRTLGLAICGLSVVLWSPVTRPSWYLEGIRGADGVSGDGASSWERKKISKGALLTGGGGALLHYSCLQDIRSAWPGQVVVKCKSSLTSSGIRVAGAVTSSLCETGSHSSTCHMHRNSPSAASLTPVPSVSTATAIRMQLSVHVASKYNFKSIPRYMNSPTSVTHQNSSLQEQRVKGI